MADNDSKKQVRRMKSLLEKMAEMAEHAEQTGSFETGIHKSVERYNNIVEHLEEEDILPEDLFPELEDDADAGQLGAEARLLADYLGDILDEEEPQERGERQGSKEGQGPKEGKGGNRSDLGLMVALAPFLEKSQLTNMVLKHFAGQFEGSKSPITIDLDITPPRKTASESDTSSKGSPDLKTIVGLAPHLDPATLGQMVRSYVARQPISDPNILISLAPFMDSTEFSQILREGLPDWFEVPLSHPAPPVPPVPPVPPTPPTPPTPAWQPHGVRGTEE